MHSVVVIGGRGFTGAELLPLLYQHPEFEVVAVGSGSAAGQPVSAHIQGMEGSNLVFQDIRPMLMERHRADACVLALPNGEVQMQPLVIDDLIEQGCRYAWRSLTRLEWQEFMGDQPYRETCPLSS